VVVASEVGDDAVDAQRQPLEVARDAHRPGAVAEMALDLAGHRRDGEARERDPARRVEAVDRLDEPKQATWKMSSKGSSGRS